MALRDYPLILLLVLVPTLAVVVEMGHRLAQWGEKRDEKYRFQFTTARDQGGILLSLMLGFTLAMSLSRYDLRKKDIVDEANAIGTAKLRVTLLPEPSRAEASRLFDAYVDARIELSEAEVHRAAFESARAKSSELQAQLWVLGTSAAEEHPTPTTALFLEAMNAAIDADERRLAGLENRVPREIWLMLGTLVVLTSLLVGLTMRRRSVLAMLILPFMFAVVAALIAELDTAGTGLIRIEAKSIERLRT